MEQPNVEKFGKKLEDMSRAELWSEFEHFYPKGAAEEPRESEIEAAYYGRGSAEISEEDERKYLISKIKAAREGR